ncbi:hypothetical protein JJB74_14775 [Noviherbaspirillum sp. DKR-6]|uniref:Uncharacterized protein n=2 Tax=Noviherbaspirillum pedocola TaxID=2801341 RepID=A0A934W238_9BURK|nr:hypothetical protein [Noviherbaspirillum pedocola]
MPAGASRKRGSEFKELESRFKKEHRYKGREDEVAARIVNKQRAQYGETIAEKQQEKAGKSPDRGLPMSGYEHMTISEVASHFGELDKRGIRKIRDYESKHKNRKGLIERIDRYLDR